MAALRQKEPELKDMTKYLMNVLGSSLTAYAVGVNETLYLHEWVMGKSVPTRDQKEKLDLLYDVTTKLHLRGDSDATVRAVMIGLNPNFEGSQKETIAERIRYFTGLDSERREIMGAVGEFLANG